MFETITHYISGANPIWYAALLFAAGVGIPVSEDVLLIWVGGMWGEGQLSYPLLAYASALYVGVVGSDFVTFGLGRLAGSAWGKPVKRWLKMEHADDAKSQARIHRFGKWVGFVQRFLVGGRVAVTLGAGFTGVSFSRYAIGAAMGGLITVPIQLSVGFVMRKQIFLATQWVERFGPFVLSGIVLLAVFFIAKVIYKNWRQTSA